MAPSSNDAILVGPNGDPISVPTSELSVQDAELLRQYKKFLQRNGLREALYCTSCWNRNLSDGCEAHVTVNEILIKCRCRLRIFRGLTF